MNTMHAQKNESTTHFIYIKHIQVLKLTIIETIFATTMEYLFHKNNIPIVGRKLLMF